MRITPPYPIPTFQRKGYLFLTFSILQPLPLFLLTTSALSPPLLTTLLLLLFSSSSYPPSLHYFSFTSPNLHSFSPSITRPLLLLLPSSPPHLSSLLRHHPLLPSLPSIPSLPPPFITTTSRPTSNHPQTLDREYAVALNLSNIEAGSTHIPHSNIMLRVSVRACQETRSPARCGYS
jgi:hypothetical protein